MAMVEPTSSTSGFPHALGPDGQKIDVIARDAADDSCATFCIYGEDHTLGNALRFVVLRNPAVEFCGYTIPHPSEFKLHIRIQTDGSLTAAAALDRALADLTDLCSAVKTSFSSAIDTISPNTSSEPAK